MIQYSKDQRTRRRPVSPPGYELTNSAECQFPSACSLNTGPTHQRLFSKGRFAQNHWETLFYPSLEDFNAHWHIIGSEKLKVEKKTHHILKEKQHSQNLLDYGDFFHITSQHPVELGCYGTLWEVPLWVGPGDKCGGNPHEIIIKSHKDIMGRTSIVFAFSLLWML